MNPKRVVIDIDGTICSEERTFEKCLATINEGAKETINRWYDEGVFIILYTARSWNEFAMTEKWLADNGIKYKMLICGKPIYDVWIDDRALRHESWPDTVKKIQGLP